MDSSLDYRHGKISKGSNCIRILHLEKEDAQIGNLKVLQGTLKTVSLERPEAFDAISYACEGQENSEYLLVDGQKIGITANTHKVLRHLRDTFGVSAFWIDSVSIAPSEEDKATQIPLMTEIYGKARKVYIWLGQPSEDYVSERALDWLQEIALDIHPLLGVRLSQFPKNMHYAEIAKVARLLPGIIRAKLRRSSAGTSRYSYSHGGMRDIIGRRWFKRMWTIQEAAMAERPVVVCGTKEITWNCLVWGIFEAWSHADENIKGDFSKVVDSLSSTYTLWLEVTRVSEFRVSNHQSWVAPESCFYEPWIAFLKFMEYYGPQIFRLGLVMIAATILVRSLRGLRPLDSIPLLILVLIICLARLLTPPKTDEHWDRGLRRGFVDMLSKIRMQESTEPKDKVYAMYGLLRKLKVYLPRPDYTSQNSLEDTYSAFTRAIIRWHASLEILRAASGIWGINGPSWVPNWSTPYTPMRLSGSGYGVDYVPPKGPRPYRFCGNLRQLVVSGMKVGTVKFRVGAINGLRFSYGTSANSIMQLYPQVNDIATLRKWLEDVKHCLSSLDAVSELLASIQSLQKMHKTSVLTEWAVTLTHDRSESGFDIPRSFMGMPACDFGHGLIQQIGERASLSNRTEWQILFHLAGNERMWQLHQQICSILAETSTFYVATIGDSMMLGSGPQNCQAGDDIVFLATLRCPFILRRVAKSSGNFHLIGVAHVPRLSWVELWPVDENHKESFTFV